MDSVAHFSVIDKHKDSQNNMHSLQQCKTTIIIHNYFNGLHKSATNSIDSGGSPHSDAYFGEGSGPINLDHVQCSGTEYNLTECETANNMRKEISHSQDVGVKCEPCKL